MLQAQPEPALIAAQDANFNKLTGIVDARLAKTEWLAGHPNLRRWMTERVEKLPCWDQTYVGPGFTLTKAA